MKTSTIKLLNQINTDFYNQISQEFSDSRNFSWKGWEKIVPFLKKSDIGVLDVGCGNGRFANFLSEKIGHSFYYHGIDNNSQLLKIVKEKNIQLPKLQTSKIDIVQSLIDEDFAKKIGNQKYNLIAVFGVMHHIPSLNLRKKMIQNLVHNLEQDGILAVAFWQFTRDQRFAYKNISREKFNIEQEDLEKNDYILDWQRGKTAYRYFHFSDDDEISEIFSGIGEVKMIEKFDADGKSDNLNRYVLVKKLN